jgi:hypothetical protein
MIANIDQAQEWVYMLMNAGMDAEDATNWVEVVRGIFINQNHAEEFIEKIAFDFENDHLVMTPEIMVDLKEEDFIGFSTGRVIELSGTIVVDSNFL